MSLLTKLFSGSSASGASAPSPDSQVFIIDGPSVFSKTNQRLGHREQISGLQRLSKMNKAEKIPTIAVFEGEPLRKVENGGKFDDLTVHFAPSADHFLDLVMDLSRKQRPKSVTIVTSDKDLEKRAKAAGTQTMRATTFRKAFDGGSNSNSSGKRKRSGRPPRKSKGGDEHKPGGSSKKRSASKSAAKKPKEKITPRDAVSELIDLVD